MTFFGHFHIVDNFRNVDKFYIFFDNCWQLLTILITDNCKDNPGDLWHLRHWLKLRTWIHVNLCGLTIKSDTGQHRNSCNVSEYFPYRTVWYSQNIFFYAMKRQIFWGLSTWPEGRLQHMLYFIWQRIQGHQSHKPTCRILEPEFRNGIDYKKHILHHHSRVRKILCWLPSALNINKFVKLRRWEGCEGKESTPPPPKVW